ncbi:MAG: DUF362 domain-containing protein [Candidatus Rokubacteria bacterium]|nr:DUF362 domain-containing protein [Candidatus Rokubacteria bacterium]
MNRRQFFELSAAALAWAHGVPGAAAARERTRVALAKSEDHGEGVTRALRLLGTDGVSRRHVVVKPNFNSADPFPGSTHPETLGRLVEWLGVAGASRVTVADRSGMGVTREVMATTGVFAQGRKLGFPTVLLDELPARDWIAHPIPGGHWSRGVLFPRLLQEAEAIVSTCALKTHRFGGHFTLSLKNSVGAVAKYGSDGYNYMSELHSSAAQRKMIAEVNLLYRPALILLDGLEAFVDGGPESGRKARPGVMLAGTDRVAVDAVGVAILRLYGTTRAVSTGKIFRQEQLARAVELGLGVAGPEQIELITDDAAGEAFLTRLRPILAAG